MNFLNVFEIRISSIFSIYCVNILFVDVNNLDILCQKFSENVDIFFQNVDIDL